MQEGFGLLWRDYKYKITSPQPANNARSLALLYEESPKVDPTWMAVLARNFEKYNTMLKTKMKNCQRPSFFFHGSMDGEKGAVVGSMVERRGRCTAKRKVVTMEDKWLLSSSNRHVDAGPPLGKQQALRNLNKSHSPNYHSTPRS
jgi:hypothetical protein